MVPPREHFFVFPGLILWKYKCEIPKINLNEHLNFNEDSSLHGYFPT